MTNATTTTQKAIIRLNSHLSMLITLFWLEIGHCRGRNWLEGHYPVGGIFRAERHFLLFKDRLAESGRQITKENITPRGKFRLVENGLNGNQA